MNWQDENLSDDLKEKIKAHIWSNLTSRRVMGLTANLFTSNIFSVIIAMLGGKESDEDNGIIK